MKFSTIDLRLFAAVADAGGITAAARKLGATKSRVSRDLAALEDRLGTRLVHRTTRKASLTEAGELLATYARRIVEEMDNAAAAIEATRETPRGQLKISVPFSILRFVLIPRLASFRARYPDIRLSIDASMRIVDLIEDGVDVAIRIGELPDSRLVARRLAVTPFVLVASPAYVAQHGQPAAPTDLAGHDILNLGASLDPQTWTFTDEDGRTADGVVTPVLTIHDPGLLLDLVRTDLGIAPMPLVYARSAIEASEVVHVLPAWTRGASPIHAIYPSRRMLAPKVRAFIAFAAEAMSAVT